MRVLAASTGDRPDDFAFTVAGELVYLSEICWRDDHGPRDCGCGRSFSGLTSNLGTTVATVTELELTRDDLAAMFADRYPDLAEDFADDLIETADEWPAGTRLRRDRDEVMAE